MTRKMLMAALVLAPLPAGPAQASIQPVAALPYECAILSEVIRHALIRREDGTTPLPAPASVGEQPSRADRHAVYAKRLEEANAKMTPGSTPFEIETLAQWDEIDAYYITDIAPEMSEPDVADLVRASGEGQHPFAPRCDWKAADIAFAPDPAQPKQWLTIRRPMLDAKDRYALVAISYGYTPTFARESLCLVEKKATQWTFRGCRDTLGS